jgi:F-box-like
MSNEFRNPPNLANLPNELTRAIFEEVATADRKDFLSLIKVCRALRGLVESLLYQNISFDPVRPRLYAFICTVI